MASIVLKNLTKTFGSVKAVAGIDLHIQDGQFVALLGPSGCGKTTTLRMISGLERPDAGSIHVDERDITHLPPRDRDVAMVFQDYALYPHMTTMDNIGYPLKVRGTSRAEIERRVTSVATSLQIGDLLDRRPGQLSGGQQQRAAVARAVVHRAQIFLFDEPLSNLDAKLRLEARAFLKHLQREVGVTAVYVTHDQSEAMALADLVVVMNKGEIMQAGDPISVYNRPANTFVASFIGNPPMNLLPCRALPQENQLHILTEGDPAVMTVTPGMLPASLSNQKQLQLGIRPEHISLADAPADDTIAARLYVTQPLGGETLVNVLVGEHLVSVRIFGDDILDLPPTLHLRLDQKRIFFYDDAGELIQ